MVQPKKFINPYTFVSLEEKCDKNIDLTIKNDEEKLTGYIVCELENLTEMFIPDTNPSSIKQHKVIKEHKIYSFFKKDDKPIIPASTLRGVIRSVYETITNSCLSTTSDSSFLYKRYSDPSKPGFIVKKLNTYFLYDVGKVITVDYNSVEDFDEFSSVKYVNNKVESDNNSDSILFKGEKVKVFCKNRGMQFKKARIFKKGNKISELSESDIKRLEYLLYLYKNSSINLHLKKGHKGYNEYLRKFYSIKKSNKGIIPVYYKKINDVYYLSPSCITKEVFENTINTLLRKNGNYEPCDDETKLCPACRLFGTTNLQKSKKYQAIGSRVRFTDAIVQSKKKYFLETKPLRDLSSPKLSAIEFYLFKPQINNKNFAYNYDYAFEWVGNTKNCIEPNYVARLRGRKYYYHHMNFNVNDAFVFEKKPTNVSAELLTRNNIFSFKVYFDNLTKKELNQLIWALDFDNVNIDENSYFKHQRAHKIGMGKPLGLGSCIINIKEIKIRNIYVDNDKIEYEIKDLDRKSFNKLEINTLSLRELFEIASYIKSDATDKMALRRKGIEITYPYVELAPNFGKRNENDDANHQWFNENRGDNIKEKINKTLPKVGFTDDKTMEPLYLEIYIREKKDNNKKQNKKPNNHR